MTQTSNERREVAERLRKLPSDIYEAVREWEVDGLFTDADIHNEADYSLIHNAVFGTFQAEHMHPGDYEELHERLADLIDPTCEMVEDEPYSCHCTACGRAKMYPLMGWNYCPYCGARMVRVNE